MYKYSLESVSSVVKNKILIGHTVFVGNEFWSFLYAARGIKEVHFKSCNIIVPQGSLLQSSKKWRIEKIHLNKFSKKKDKKYWRYLTHILININRVRDFIKYYYILIIFNYYIYLLRQYNLLPNLSLSLITEKLDILVRW